MVKTNMAPFLSNITTYGVDLEYVLLVVQQLLF